jgi:hypothetical protein
VGMGSEEDKSTGYMATKEDTSSRLGMGSKENKSSGYGK